MQRRQLTVVGRGESARIANQKMAKTLKNFRAKSPPCPPGGGSFIQDLEVKKENKVVDNGMEIEVEVVAMMQEIAEVNRAVDYVVVRNVTQEEEEEEEEEDDDKDTTAVTATTKKNDSSDESEEDDGEDAPVEHNRYFCEDCIDEDESMDGITCRDCHDCPCIWEKYGKLARDFMMMDYNHYVHLLRYRCPDNLKTKIHADVYKYWMKILVPEMETFHGRVFPACVARGMEVHYQAIMYKVSEDDK